MSGGKSVAEPGMVRTLRKVFAYREISVLLILALELFVFFLIVDVFLHRGEGHNVFLTSRNMLLVLRYSSIYAIASVGAAMIIISFGIDLAPGSVMALTAVVTGHCYVNLDLPLALACPIGLLVGIVCGALASLMVVKINLLPFIATLGIMGVARGLAFIMMQGKTFLDLSAKIPRDLLIAGFKFTDVLKFVPVFMTIVIALFFHWFMLRHRWGRQIHAVGGNETAARFSGVKVGWMKTIVYMTGAILASVSGLILAVVEGQAQQSMALGYELDIIAAAVVGGASLSGGKGSVLGAVIGAFIFGVLRNGLNLIPNASYYERFIVGLAVVIIVVIDQFTAKRQARMK